MSNSSYLLKSPARALAAHVGDDSHHGFLLGTGNLRGPNDVRLLRYSEDDDDIACVASFGHPGEVVALAPCPQDASVVVTTQNALPGLRSTIWRMPDLPVGGGGGDDARAGGGGGVPPADLVPLAQLPGLAARVRAVAWAPVPLDSSGGGGAARGGASSLGSACLVSVDDTSIRTYTLRPDGSAGSALVPGAEISCGDVGFCGGVAWDPHHTSEVAVAVDGGVGCWDTRTCDRLRSVGSAVAPAGLVVRALSYNPNRPWYLATGGDDMRVRVWDLRRMSCALGGGSGDGAAANRPLLSATPLPVKVLDGHTHWVTSVAFNPFHDQLLLSGGSDGRAVLWRVSSISSAPLLELGDEDVDPDTGKKAEPKLAPDAAIRTHDDDHDDSITAAVWSAHNAWVYASLSYAGRLVVAQVPSAEKYRVLL